MALTTEQRIMLAELRFAGYAICMFTPEELNGINPAALEDRLIPFGWECIDFYHGNQPDEEE